MKFTKERIESLLQFNSEGSDCQANAEQWEVHELARMAMAALTAEPEAYVDPFSLQNFATFRAGETDNKRMGREWVWANPGAGLIPLYAAPQLPQPAVVVSEAQSKKLFDEWSGGDGALGDLRASGVPDEFISMLKEFSLATWEACREAMLKHSAPFIVTSDHRMMEMPKVEDIDAVAAMLQGAEPVKTELTLREGLAAIRNSGIAIDAEKIQAERDDLNASVIPDGYALVPVDMAPEMMRAVQLNSELGGYAAANLSGAYSLFREFWDVAIAAVPQPEVKP